jgi:hypothetical protein
MLVHASSFTLLRHLHSFFGLSNTHYVQRKYGEQYVRGAIYAYLFSCRIGGSHRGSYEEFYLAGYNTLQSVESRTSCYLLHVVFYLAYFPNLKIEVTCSSET